MARTKLHNNLLQNKSGQNRETESLMQNKETFVCLFYERPKRDIAKL